MAYFVLIDYLDVLDWCSSGLKNVQFAFLKTLRKLFEYDTITELRLKNSETKYIENKDDLFWSM